MAKLTIVYGPVSSGKTVKLAEFIDQAKAQDTAYLVCKSAMDTRTGRSLSSVNPALNGRVPALAFNSPWQILEHAMPSTRLLVIDEAHFFDLTDVIMVLKKLSVRRELDIVIAGRDLDHLGRPHSVFQYLTPRADTLHWCPGRCARCGDAAEFTFFKGEPGLKIVVVGGGLFEPRCGACFKLGLTPQPI